VLLLHDHYKIKLIIKKKFKKMIFFCYDDVDESERDLDLDFDFERDFDALSP